MIDIKNSSRRIQLAMDICRAAHKGQFRKFSGEAYTEHPLRIADMVRTYGEECIIVALLHDVVEDSTFKINDIKAGFSPEISKAVDLLTHKQEDTYDDYIAKIKPNSIARVVKIADLYDNMHDYFIYEKDWKQFKKYVRAMYYLAYDKMDQIIVLKEEIKNDSSKAEAMTLVNYLRENNIFYQFSEYNCSLSRVNNDVTVRYRSFNNFDEMCDFLRGEIIDKVLFKEKE